MIVLFKIKDIDMSESEITKDCKPITVKFTACSHLDFSDNYAARKQILGSGKVFWMREVGEDLPSMVQFCTLIGRLNNPEPCLSQCSALCGQYAEEDRIVEVPDP